MKTLYSPVLIAVLLFTVTLCFGQTAERDQGIELYGKGSYKESAELLEKAVKASPNDAVARTVLALAQIKLDKYKDAEKMLVKSLEIDPNQPGARKSLAVVYLVRGKPQEAIAEIQKLSALQPPDEQAFYILGLAQLRLGDEKSALDNAGKAIERDPKYADAYLLKAQAIMSQWNEKTRNYKQLAAAYGSPVDHIGKFITLSAASPEAPFWRTQQEALRVFAAYYEERENRKGTPDKDNPNYTPMKLLTRPQAEYTGSARNAGVEGRIRVLVGFGENGRVEHVVLLTRLGNGLDEAAVKAAKKIKFVPATRDGKPVLTVRVVEYAFIIE